MAYQVFVDGQEGTTGLRIHEYLAQRTDVQVLRIDPDKRKDPIERARLLNAADVAFLCLPDDAAVEAASWVTNPQTCLIDASTAHRTAPGWTFGLPELAPGQRALLRTSKRIANPGCHASAFILLMRPLIEAKCVLANTPVAATSLTGYSGGGKKMIEQYEAGLADLTGTAGQQLAAPRPYALGLAHKHIPEMMAHTGLQTKPVFMPIVGPFYKGLCVSVPLHLSHLPAGTTAAKLHAALAQHYAGEAFVKVQALNDPQTLQSGFFDVQGANGSNRVDIFVFANEHTPPGEVMLMARLDNLGKGASGAAVQSMNVHLGLAEDLGL